MRKSTFALALAVLVAIAWLMHGSQPRAAEDAKPAVQKWEYEIMEINRLDNDPKPLRRMGESGWELQSAVQFYNPQPQVQQFVLFFKRPKQ